MLWLRVVALTLSLGAAWWLGIELAVHALGAPSRLSRAALGAGVAVVALGVPLLWLPRVLPTGAALLVAGALCALVAAWLHRRATRPARPDSPRAIAGLVLLSALAYLSALAFWFEGTAGEGDVATLYLHSGLATAIARGNFPVLNPFEPDYALQYRVTFHTLAGGVIDLLGAPTREVMPHVMAGTAVATLAAVYGALATLLSAPWALGGAALAYAWGPLYWLLALSAVRERGLGDVLGVVVEAPRTVAWSGVVLGGPFTMPTHNPTVLHGFIPAVVTAVAFGAALSGRPSRWLAAALALAALTYLGASNEFLVFAVPAGFLAATWLARRCRPRKVWLPTLAVLAAVAVAFLLNQTTSGVLAGFFAGDPDVGRLHPQLNGEHLGELPSWGYNSRGPWAQWPMSGWHDVPIASLEFLVDGGPLLWILGLTLLWVGLRRGHSRAAPWALVAAANVAVPVVFRLEQSAADLYRVLHAGLTLAVPAAAIAAAEVAERWPRARPAWAGVALLTAGIMCGAFLITSIAWPRMVAQAQTPSSEVPPGAVAFLLGETDVTDRLLVLSGARTAFELYDGRSPRTTAHISADTGQFIPYGYHHLSHAEQYAPRYGWAQRWLRDVDLADLRIRYVYADPRELDATQAAEIAAKLADGRLREVYRDPEGAAVIYEFVEARD